MDNGLLNIPESMIGDKSSLLNEFCELAIKEDETKEFAIMIEKLLPNEIRDTTVWFNNLNKRWEYYYGQSINNLSSSFNWVGSTNHFPVKYLYLALKIAYKNLTKEQLVEYINRLKNVQKHSDVLFEMRPLMNVGKLYKIFFEVNGYGIRNKTLDWRISILYFNIVFDVKNRLKSLINQLEEITPYLNAGANEIIPQATNPRDLFKSVEDKFLEKKYFSQLQGVWIQTQIKEKKSNLDKYFYDELNPQKIHFAILSGWKEDAYILTRNKFIKYFLKKLFHIKESERYVTENYL
jgi:hypothetical protein